MSRVSSVVEVNGHRYDASTGQLLGSVKKGTRQIKSTASGVVDGFIRQSSTVTVRKNVAKKRAGIYASQAVHRSAERSRTLMRTVVKKPSPQKHGAMSERSYQIKAETKAHGKPTLRAHGIKKHSKVHRYGHLPASTATKSTTALTGEVIQNRESRAAEASVPSSPQSSILAGASQSQIEQLLDHALTSSRERSSHRSGSKGMRQRMKLLPKKLTIGLSFLVVATASGVFAWQNVPEVAVKVAAARAKIHASAPAYTPEGFSFAAPVSYRSGEVVLSYQTTDGKSYRITQKVSKLDSASLASNILLNESNVQTSQVKGNTIYIYGEENGATWVNNGVLYTISDGAGLDTEQILRIAGSL